MILVSMERGDPTLYYGTNSYTLGMSISNTQGVVLPLGRRVTKKKKKAREDEG